MNPEVGIILVTYNDEKNLRLLFSSLKKQNYQNFIVFLIDNNSEDESVQTAKQLYSNIVVKRLSKNEGFAKASNIGAKLAVLNGCELVFILNNDVELDRDCIRELVNLIDRDRKIACVGPIVFKGTRNSGKKTIQEYGGQIDFRKYLKKKNFVNINFDDSNSFPDILYVDFIMGGALMVKAEVVNKIGFFDERYFMYGEEVDLYFRIKEFQYRMAVTKRAKLWHNHYSDSASNNLKRYYFERYYIMKNKYLYFLKFKFYKGLLLSLLKDIFFSPLIYKSYVKRGEFKIFHYHLRGIFDGIRNIRGKSDRIYI